MLIILGERLKEKKTCIGVVLEHLLYNLLITRGEINFILCGFAYYFVLSFIDQSFFSRMYCSVTAENSFIETITHQPESWSYN